MKIITSVTGSSIEGQFADTGGVLQQVLEEPRKGFFRSTKLGRAGLVLKRADAAVAIPLEVLWQLAEAHEPALQLSTAPEATPEPRPIE